MQRIEFLLAGSNLVLQDGLCKNPDANLPLAVWVVDGIRWE